MGEGGEEKKDRYQRLAAKFKERVEGKTMSAEAQEVFDEGIEKLVNAKNKESLDVETTKQYLDWISALPWDHRSEDNRDIARARHILDSGHYGMKRAKERILEVIACSLMKGPITPTPTDTDTATKEKETEDSERGSNDSKILCLVGPPGTGKTSIGQSMADSLHRKFFKFSLGES